MSDDRLREDQSAQVRRASKAAPGEPLAAATPEALDDRRRALLRVLIPVHFAVAVGLCVRARFDLGGAPGVASAVLFSAPIVAGLLARASTAWAGVALTAGSAFGALASIPSPSSESLFAAAVLSALEAGLLLTGPASGAAAPADVASADLERLNHEADRQRFMAERFRLLTAGLALERNRHDLFARASEWIRDLGYAGCLALGVEEAADGRRLAGRSCSLPGELDVRTVTLPIEDPTVRAAFDTGCARLDEPVRRKGLPPELKRLMSANAVANELALPLHDEGKAFGCLLIWSSNERNGGRLSAWTYGGIGGAADAFAADTRAFLIALTESLSLAFENARLHEEMVEAQSRLGAENEAARALATELATLNETRLAVQTELEAQFLALEEANEKLKSLATTDGMTGLANHRAFQEELTRQIARVQRSNAPLSLLLLDVDRFKEYNDNFGHPSGDEVLKIVSRILQSVVREGDFPARYGGEEFAVILPDTDADTAAQVAERLRETVEAHVFPNRAVTVSIGIADHVPATGADAMIQCADVALYEAKSAGRNRVVRFAGNSGEVPGVGESGAKAAAIDDGAARAERQKLAHPFIVSGGADSPAAPFEEESPSGNERLIAILSDGGLEGLLQEPPIVVLADLLSALDRRGAEPIGHCARVARFSMRLGRSLCDVYERERVTRPLIPRLTPADLVDLAYGALLHDIGKVGIPDALLHKFAKPSEDEWRQIRRHPLAGAEMIADCPVLSRALPIVRFHHERWDGAGYPQGLSGEEIPLSARIFAVCDTLDVLTTSKPYRERLDLRAAIREIARGAGTQFDPDVVKAFLSVPESEWAALARTSAHQLDASAALPFAA